MSIIFLGSLMVTYFHLFCKHHTIFQDFSLFYPTPKQIYFDSFSPTGFPPSWASVPPLKTLQQAYIQKPSIPNSKML